MAFKLTGDESKAHNAVIDKLSAAREVLDAAVEAYNEAVLAAHETLAEAVGAYNEVLAEAAEHVSDIESRFADEIGEKSEKWREGDRGQAAEDVRSQWEGAASELEPIELDEPEPLELDCEDHAELLGSLPDEID
jgi:hypothetical protein